MSEAVAAPAPEPEPDKPSQVERTPVIPAQVPSDESSQLKGVIKNGLVTKNRVTLVSNPLLVQAALPYINAGLPSDVAVQKALEKFKDATADDIISAAASLETAPAPGPETTEAQPKPTEEDLESAREVAKYRYLMACARRITGKINGLSRQELYEMVCTSTDDFTSFDAWVDRVEG